MTAIIICVAALTLPGAEIPPYCIEDTAVPLLVTWYDPQRGGVNCDIDCSTLADGLPLLESDYGHVAACPAHMHYATIFTPYGVWKCRDAGGGIVVENHPQFGPVVRVDVLSTGPIAGQYDIVLIEDWFH